MDFHNIQQRGMEVEKTAILSVELLGKVVNQLLSISCHILC
jgi:hypothetical protein